MNSCAICMETATLCKLVCGHSFCHSCVKEWYFKSEHCTCPMCRNNLYFRGMARVVDTWEKQKYDQCISDAYAKAVETVFDTVEDDFVLEDLLDIEEKFNKLVNTGEEWDPEELYEVLVDPFIEISFIDDSLDFYKYVPKQMFVSKHPHRKITPKNKKKVRAPRQSVSTIISSTPILIML